MVTDRQIQETQPPKLLVIDDDDIIHRSCRKILSKENLSIEAAYDGSSGLAKLKEIGPDIVLIDLKMPGIDGIEVLEKIRKFDEQIVPIVITGYATIDTAIAAMKRGAYDFINKPFTPEELLIAVKRGIEMRRLRLKAAQARQEKEDLTRNFISIVSHEIRSPLATAQQNLGIVLSGRTGQLEGKHRELLARVDNQLTGLLNLVSDWQRIVNESSRKIVEHVEPIRIDEVVRASFADINRPADRRDVAVQMEFPIDLPRVSGNRERLKEAFSNLLDNSLKYNREEGKVTITARAVGAEVAVSITDTGIGIDAKHLPFIFDQFFRVDHVSGSGAGLGLFITKKIIEAHSGRIEVQSEIGKGSSFIVYLPVSQSGGIP